MSEDTGSVPGYRLAEVIAERKKLADEVVALKENVAKLNGRIERQAEKHVAEITEAVDKASAAQLGFDMDKALIKAGIDDDDTIDFLRHKFKGVEPTEGEEDKTFAQWFDGYKESKPAILRAFLEKVETDAAPAKPTRQVNAAPAKPETPAEDLTTNGRVNGQAPNMATITPESLARMSAEQVKAMGGIEAIMAAKFGGNEPQ